MTQYHIAANGKPAPCKAAPGNCPLGGRHFNTKDEADFYQEHTVVLPADGWAVDDTEWRADAAEDDLHQQETLSEVRAHVGQNRRVGFRELLENPNALVASSLRDARASIAADKMFAADAKVVSASDNLKFYRALYSTDTFQGALKASALRGADYNDHDEDQAVRDGLAALYSQYANQPEVRSILHTNERLVKTTLLAYIQSEWRSREN